MRLPVVIFALSSIFLGLGCEPPVQPGVSLGTFQVTGSLDENGCGAAVPAIDPISFEVELRDDYGRGVWVMPEQPIQTGIRTPDGSYRFRSGTTLAVIPEEPGYPGCSLQQVDFVEVQVTVYENGDGETVPAETPDLDDDAGVGSLLLELEILGSEEVQFAPTRTSDCSPLPVVNGGPWAELPCTLTYTLFGTGVGPDPALLDDRDDSAGM